MSAKWVGWGVGFALALALGVAVPHLGFAGGVALGIGFPLVGAAVGALAARRPRHQHIYKWSAVRAEKRDGGPPPRCVRCGAEPSR